MYLTYVDESGKPDFEDPEPNYVLAAITINEKKWNEVNEQIIDLKRKYFPNQDVTNIEIHAYEIFSRRGPFVNFTLDTRLKIFKDILNIVANNGLAITTVIVRKDHLDLTTDVKFIAAELLYGSINHSIEEENNNHIVNNNKEYGLVMIDSVNNNYDNKIKKKIRIITNLKNTYSDRCVIEEPLFIDSKHSNLLQVVDCVAYCVRRKFRTEKSSNVDLQLFDDYYRIIEGNFLRFGGNVKGYGLIWFPSIDDR